MAEHIASKGKPYILAAGVTADEVDRVAAGLSINSNIALLQCNIITQYLENFKYIQLNVLKSFLSCTNMF